MRRATITKQRIHKNRRLIIAATRHVTSGSRYALTRSLHTVNKLAKERPHAPLRPGDAHIIAHHQQKSFPHPRAPHKQPPTRQQRQTQGRTSASQITLKNNISSKPRERQNITKTSEQNTTYPKETQAEQHPPNAPQSSHQDISNT